MYSIVYGQLCVYATEWAKKLAREGKFQHRPNNKYGENLHSKWSSSPQPPSAKEACDYWYSEIKDYSFGQQTMGSSGILHITHTNTFVMFLPCKSCPQLQ
jgi:hypothetical protein